MRSSWYLVGGLVVIGLCLAVIAMIMIGHRSLDQSSQVIWISCLIFWVLQALAWQWLYRRGPK